MMYSLALQALVVLSSSQPFFVNAKPNNMKKSNKMKVNANSCKNNGRKCRVDSSGFNITQPKDDVSEIDLGPGRNYECKSNGSPKGRGATFHAECTSTSMGNSKNKGGAMNAISRKNSKGEDVIYASVNVDGEVCNITPGASGEESVVNCIPEDEFPPEADPFEETVLYPPGAAAEEEEEIGGRFREFVTEPVDEHRGQLTRDTASNGVGLRGGRQQQRGLIDDLGGTLDVMVLWTVKSECANAQLPVGCTVDAESEELMRGMIDLAVAETNTAYELSGIDTELRLVHAYREESYVEQSVDAFDHALGEVTNNMPEVRAKRSTYGADLVAFIIDDPQYCGLAHLGPRYEIMYSVSKWSCATGYYTFGHEIGHNMGCNHDKGTANVCGSSTYNYGWRDPQGRFRSIMSYECNYAECDNIPIGRCPKVQRFSNPEPFTYDGEPTAIGNAEVNNARQINNVRSTIAAYEAFVPDCEQDSDCEDSNPCTTNLCNGVCIFEPMDCNDDNDCTEDSCSGGTCTNTDISGECDDGNACTTDTCNIFGGCSNAIIPGCCGNGICEEEWGETTETCFDDCALGPFTIEAPLCNPCYGGYGQMFDVVAKAKDVTITSMKMFYYSGTIAEVWTRPGTHAGFSGSFNGWTKVAEHDFSGMSAYTIAAFPESSFTQTVQIPAGSTQAFYVALRRDGYMLFNLGSDTSEVVVEDDDLIIYKGPAGSYQYVGMWGSYAWNGQMVYMAASPVPDCTQDGDCEDNNPCTTNLCDNGVCIFEPMECDDGNDCTADSCSGGTCVHTDISNECDDGNACTTNMCNILGGCSNAIIPGCCQNDLDCNDDNDCTADSCSGGTCTNTDISGECDDGNACTTDTCDAVEGCSNAIIPGCCGNGICEEEWGETTETCFDDCALGPFTIEAPLCSRCYGGDGQMFDVVAKAKDVTITSMKFFYYSGTIAEVWTRPGTHAGFSGSSNGWTKVAEHDFSGTSRITVAAFPESSFTQTVQIPAGSTQAFYVTLRRDGNMLYNLGSDTSEVVVEDDDLIIYKGPAGSYQFVGMWGSYAWNGQMVYMAGSTELVPQIAPNLQQVS